MLLNIRVSVSEKTPKIISVQFYQCNANTLALCKYQRGFFTMVPTSYEVLFLEALPHSIGVPS